MGLISKQTFICLDCETTGLDVTKDRIIELAAVKFTFNDLLESKETLINPECPIPAESQCIHHISQTMVSNKPKIKQILPDFLKFIGNHIIVGHSISFDIQVIIKEAQRNQIPCSLEQNTSIDTLRLARLYGESPINSLEFLRTHFNIEETIAHRAMGDVTVNIAVFKHLSSSFTHVKELLLRLEKPIKLRAMPLGKHKGRKFSEIPLDYLQWAAGKDFDQDLLFSLRYEINTRKKRAGFGQSSNPFTNL